MPMKCPHCHADIISKPISKLPLWEGEPFKSRFNLDALRWKNLNLKNLIIGDWINFIIIVSVLLLAWSYTHDTEACREIYNQPCKFVNDNIRACADFEKQNQMININNLTMPSEEENAGVFSTFT